MILTVAKLLRPHQWTKNLLCYAGLIFGGRLLEVDSIISSTLAFVWFSIASSSVYILNDIVDLEQDRLHPKKQDRPIPSGRISISTGIVLAIVLSLGALLGAYVQDSVVFLFILIYILNNILYSTKLKNIPIIDVLWLAFGFVLRLLSGIYVLGDAPTAWIVLCTLFLAAFLGFAKRRSELVLWEGIGASPQRPVLLKYSVAFLESLLSDAALLSIVSYALFTTTSGKNPTLVVTVPLVYYAVMRYKQLVIIQNQGEEPEFILIKDWRIWISVILWIITYVYIDYFKLHLFY